MVFGFLAVEAVGNIPVVVVGKCDTCGCSQGDAFVGRAEQYIEFTVAVDDGLGIKTPETGQMVSFEGDLLERSQL